MRWTKNEHKKFNKGEYSNFILAGDIGGTNSSLGICGVKNGFSKLLVSFSFKSREIGSFHRAVNEILRLVKQEYNISATKACFGVAGVVSPDKKSAEIAKLGLNLSSRSIIKKTGLKQAIFINDFQAIGYAVNIIKKGQFAVIKNGIKVPKSNILVIGAGTGLGKSLLVFDKNEKFYEPVASEGGHTDFPAQTSEEAKLVEFIKGYRKIKNVPYEQLLSGPGLSNIYLFLRKSERFGRSECTKEVDRSSYNPELISKYRKSDKTCRAAFGMFKKVYAKFARNMAIDGLSLGGVYIGGGMAPKNKEIFDREFIKTFEQSSDSANILKNIPIYLILDRDMGLAGAGFAGARMLR